MRRITLTLITPDGPSINYLRQPLINSAYRTAGIFASPGRDYFFPEESGTIFP